MGKRKPPCGEVKTPVGGLQNLRWGTSKPPLGEVNSPTGRRIRSTGLTIQLHWSQKSAPRVPQFRSLGLKNPLRLGSRELSTTWAPCSTPLRCLSLASSFACLPYSSPLTSVPRSIPYSAGLGLRVKDCDTNSFFFLCGGFRGGFYDIICDR